MRRCISRRRPRLARLAAVALGLGMLTACGSEIEGLLPGFYERIGMGYGCPDRFYMALDSDQTFRIEADLPPGETVTFPLDPSTGALTVTSGIRLLDDQSDFKCDGEIEKGTAYQTYLYEPTEGTATVVDNQGLRLVGLEGVVLRPVLKPGRGYHGENAADLDEVVIEGAELPAFPITGNLTLL